VEPRPISESLLVVGRQLGVPSPGALDRVWAVWGEVAGRLAVVAEPVAVRHGRLVVAATEPAVAEALEWQGAAICDRLASVLPDLDVTAVEVRLRRG
jgi:hypothetical protein